MDYKTLSINWCVPYYRLSLDGLQIMTEQLASKDDQDMLCLTRFMSSPSAPFVGASFTYDLGAKANIPRYTIVGMKWFQIGAAPALNQVDQITINRSLLTHGFVTDIWVTIGSERYPFSPMLCDFPNNKYSVPYQLFRDFCRSYGISPSTDYIDFRDRFPIFCFDLSARASLLDTNTTSQNVQINVTRNVPVANAADHLQMFALQFNERHFMLNFASGLVRSNDQF